MGRTDRIQREAAALWRQLYGEPPPFQADGAATLDQLLKGLPEAGYERLRSPHLSRADVTLPRGA